jgi:hypothetical protein
MSSCPGPAWSAWATTSNACPASTAVDVSSFYSAVFAGGVRLIDPANYSVGAAADTEGNVYFTEWSKQRVMIFSPADGSLKPIMSNIVSAFGIGVAPDGTVYVGSDSDTNGTIVRRKPSGAVDTIMSGIVRPRQIFVGDDGYVYVVSEVPGSIPKWNPATGQTTTVVSGILGIEDVVEKNGTLYWLIYEDFAADGTTPKASGSIMMRTPDGTITTLVKGISRGRGLVMTADGTLIGTSESNVSDQGNSGYIFSYKPGGQPVLLAGGLDYPQRPAVAPDGMIYTTLVRDYWLVSVPPTLQAGSWPVSPGYGTCLFNGTISAAGTGDTTSISVENVSATGDLSKHVSGWVKIPASWTTTSKAQVSEGIYPLPAVSCVRSSGAVCDANVIVERVHTGQRWPVTYDNHGAVIPAPGFDESPINYWLFIQS